MTSLIELIKAHVLNRLADAADPFVQVMVDNGTGLKECEHRVIRAQNQRLNSHRAG